MGDAADLLVIGGGPAGMAAALTASGLGVATVLVDMAATVENVSRRLQAAFGHLVWSVSSELRVDAVGLLGPVSWRPRAVVVAIGAVERIVPFPGWTLPGIIGLTEIGANVKPGDRVVVAGTGPAMLSAADAVRQAGGELVAVIRRAILSAWRGADGLEIAAAPSMPGGSSVRLAADWVAVGNGLVPAVEVTRLLRARHRFSRDAGGWVPELDGCGRSSVPRVYVAGAAAGLCNAEAAAWQGRLAALAACRDLGALTSADVAECKPPRVAAAATDHLAQIAAIPPDTVVCRCEALTRADIEAAVADGAREMNQLKAFTRCGMGSCQGRICGDVAAELVANLVGGREAAGSFTGRAPLRPIGLAALTGDFDYADIPIPASAPL